MAGFLDKKNRLIDFKLTNDGRLQIANDNDLRFKYYTFSDSSIVYHENFDTQSDNRISDSLTTVSGFLPFENDSEISIQVNPEMYLDGKVSFENRNSDLIFNNNTTSFTTSDILISKKYLDKKSFNIIEDDQILFSRKEERDTFDFINSNNVRKYPTIMYMSESIEDLDEMLYDKRFSESSRFKTLVPVNTDGGSIDVENKDPKNPFNINYLFKTFDDPSLTISEQDSRSASINKILDALEESNKVYYQKYEINQDYQRQEDAYIFEMHEVKNANNAQSLDKLVFIKIGDFISSNTGVQRTVYLIGKIILSRQTTNTVSSENRRFVYDINNDYCFINMFTLVVE